MYYTVIRLLNIGVLTMIVELTATTDLQRATIKDANSARMHNEHDPNVNHENVQIIKEDTELNKHTVFYDRDKLLEQHYGKMIKERNEKTRQRFLAGKIGQNEYQKRLTNVNKYLNADGKTPKQALTNYVFTLGNVETEFKLLDQLGFKYERQKVKDSEGKFHDRPRLNDKKQREEFAQIMNETYVSLARNINHTKDCGFKVVDVWLHMDEGGMPHAQGEIVNLGHTATGKPSYNLNQALGEFNKHFDKDVYTSKSTNKQGKQAKSPNGKTALKEFRRIVDSNMVKDFNKALKKHNLDKKVTAKGIRLGHKGGLSMSEYQSQQQAKEAYQKTQEALRTSYKQLTGKDAINEQNEPMSPLECSKAIKKVADNIKKEKDKTDSQIEDNKNTISDQQQQIEEQNSNLQVVKDSILQQNKDLEEAKERLRQRRLQRRQLAQEELEEDGLTFGNNEPVTDENVVEVEKTIDNYRNNKRKKWNSDKEAVATTLRKNRNLLSRLDNLDKQAKAEGTTADKIINDRGNLLNRLKYVGKAYEAAEKVVNLATSVFLKQPFTPTDPSLVFKGKRQSASERAYWAGVNIENYENATSEEKRENLRNLPGVIEKRVSKWLEQTYRKIFKKNPFIDTVALYGQPTEQHAKPQKPNNEYDGPSM